MKLLKRLGYLILVAIVLAMIVFFIQGCTLPDGIRKVTTWGVVIPTPAGPIAIGYWHSEHGEGVESEQSSRPEDVL